MTPLQASHDRPRLLVFPRALFTTPDEEPELLLLDDDEALIEDEETPPLDSTDSTDSSPSPALDIQAESESPYTPPDGEAGLVTLAETGGEPILLYQFHADIVERCADTIAMLARHRTERRAGERAGEEARILELTDAIAATDHRCVEALMSWFERSADSPDPWKIWALAFVLGTFDGRDTLDAVAHVLRQLPPQAARKAQLAAEALALSPRPDLRDFAAELARSPLVLPRAVGVDLLGRFNGLSREALMTHLRDPASPVVVAAVRSTLRLATPDPALVPHLIALLDSRERIIAWEASRALALLDRPEPYDDVQSGGGLATVLGDRLIDLLVLYGSSEDLPRIEATLRRAPVTATHLDGVARFGHPRSWAFLVHFLADEDLASDAADALVVLFGPLVEHRRRLDASAWRDALTQARFDPTLRLRGGEPWRPGALVGEHRRGRISARALEGRMDEAAVRARLTMQVDIQRWSPDLTPSLQAFFTAAERADTTYRAGTWDCAVRPSARR